MATQLDISEIFRLTKLTLLDPTQDEVSFESSKSGLPMSSDRKRQTLPCYLLLYRKHSRKARFRITPRKRPEV